MLSRPGKYLSRECNNAWLAKLELSSSRLHSPLLAFANHFRQIRGGADLERSGFNTRMFRHQLDRMLQIARFKHKNSAQLLFRFGVGDRP